MADVPIIKSWAEARPYLVTLKDTIDADIRPLLATAGAAPFAINREVLSYVDHLGHLYTGKAKVGQRSKDYLVAMMAKADPNYGKRAAEIYEMYRCGSVHELEPKALTNTTGQFLRWFCYAGDRKARVSVDRREIAVTHLEPLRSAQPGKFWLPVSTVCLISDLEISIDAFIQAGPEADRVAAWNLAAQQLNAPVPFNFTV